jgi:hypothetical protein
MHSAQLLEKKVNVVIVEHARQRQFLDETVVCHRDTPRRNLPEKNAAAQIFVFPRLATSGLSGWPADRRKRRDGDRTPQVLVGRLAVEDGDGVARRDAKPGDRRATAIP